MGRCRRSSRARWLGGCALAGLALTAHGAGFYLTQVGTPGSLGTAGVGNTTSYGAADSAWTNPAAMTGADAPLASAGMTFIFPQIEFDSSVAAKGGSDGGNAGSFAFAPGGFHVRPIGDRLRLGLGMTAPMGGGFDFGDDFVGRYGAQKVKLLGVGLSGSLGYAVTDSLSLGAGVTVVYTQFEQRLALNQGPLPDGKIHFDRADDWGAQGYFGLHWKATERASVGVVYRTEFDADLEGDVVIQGLRTPFDPVGDLEVEWTNPQLLDVGVRYAVRDDLELMISGGWQDWSAFSANRIGVTTRRGVSTVGVLDRRFDDTWNLGVALQKELRSGALVAFGFKYDSSPVSDANRTVDLPFDENWTISASYARRFGESVDVGFGASLLYAGEGALDQTAQGVRFAGEFDRNLLLFLGGSMRYRF